MKWKIAVFVIVAGVLFTWYDYASEDFTRLESDRREQADPTVTTSTGTMRYRVYGAGNKPAIVLIHSFNGFIESWEKNANVLADAGFRVIVYDLWGRGFSDRPRIKLSLSVFRQQLTDLMNHVGAQRAHLVGASFGAVIAADFAIHYPERGNKVAMVGPAGWPEEGTDVSVVGTAPIIGDVLFHYFGTSFLRSTVDAYLVRPADNRWVTEHWSRFADYPGFTRSALSTLRESPVRDYLDGWKDYGAMTIPTLILWGTRDVSFPYDNAEKIPQLMPHANVVAVEDGAHWVNVENSDQVNHELVRFLTD